MYFSECCIVEKNVAPRKTHSRDIFLYCKLNLFFICCKGLSLHNFFSEKSQRKTELRRKSVTGLIFIYLFAIVNSIYRDILSQRIYFRGKKNHQLELY